MRSRTVRSMEERMPAVHKATVDIYEHQAAEYRARRPPRYRRQARAFARRVLPDTPVDDLGGVDDLLWARARRARALPDTVAAGMRALVCGLNPSLVAADAGFGYAGATNRFWPAAIEAGLVSRPRDPLHALVADGVGMTD